MRKLLMALGVVISTLTAGLLATGAPIPLFTVANSGCNEASQLMACLNNLINQLNGSSGALISFGVGGTSSGGAVNGTSSAILPQAPGGTNPWGPGTSSGSGSQFTPVVLNAQRGVVSFLTPLGVATNSSTLMVENSFITSTSNCQATVLSAGFSGTGGQQPVFVSNMTPTTGIWSGTTSQGVLLINLANAGLTAINTVTYSIGFWCQ